ncbi:hypothetical protein [Microscilla marina]|uniref:Membrane protein, putative n=1 Tax=Microscilla marina ATCC 23134 TaxID=313606 RepID=A2A075_MICM2|nr:hypothetical protein [Microscilla marina]EAY23964.1 membrane protein, putative [Microscilla marina ATCC 23134]
MLSSTDSKLYDHKKSRAYRPAFFVVTGLWFIFLLGWLGGALWWSFQHYNTVTLWVAQVLGKTQQIDTLRTQYFTPAVFISFQILGWLLFVMWGLAYCGRSWVTLLLLRFLSLVKTTLAFSLHSFITCSLSQKIILIATLCGVLASRLYYATVFTLQYDEAFTYIHLVHKGVLVAAIYYPGPNNHVFFSEIAALLHLFLPTLVALRLPSIIASLAVWYLAWQWLHRYTRFEWAWLLATLGTFLPLVSVYSVMGRGYSMQLLFILLAFRVGLAANYRAQQRLVFIVSSVLGFYTIPVFLYPFATLLVCQSMKLWRQDKKLLKRWAIDLCIVAGLTCLLYSPIVLANGAAALVGNGWVKPLSLATWGQQFPAYLAAWGNALFGNPWGQWLGLVCGLGVLLIFIFRRKAGKFALFCVVIPLLMIALQRVLPPQRVWLWLWLPLVYTIALLLGKSIPRLKSYLISVLLGGICLFFVIHTSYLFAQMPTKNYPYIRVAKKITSMPALQRVFVQHDTYGVYLQYMCLHVAQEHSLDTRRNPQVKYDWLIVKKPLGRKLPERRYQVFLENEEVVVYQRFE